MNSQVNVEPGDGLASRTVTSTPAWNCSPHSNVGIPIPATNCLRTHTYGRDKDQLTLTFAYSFSSFVISATVSCDCSTETFTQSPTSTDQLELWLTTNFLNFFGDLTNGRNSRTTCWNTGTESAYNRCSRTGRRFPPNSTLWQPN